MTRIHCLHELIDYLARNGAVIVLSPFNTAELDPSLDLGKLQVVAWPVTQFTLGATTGVTRWEKVPVRSPGRSDGETLDPQQ